MTTHSQSAVTRGECVVCGGSCKEPHRLTPVAANYPFMSAEHIAATHPAEPAAVPPRQRARRLAQDRQRQPENHAVEREDRSA